MRATATLARDHQTILCGLEVLRLIGERLEVSHEVDAQDIEVVLGFMDKVAHRCLDNTEELLRPALEKAAAGETASLCSAALANHQQVRSLFSELTRTADTREAAACDEFAKLSKLYTTLLANVILEERRVLLSVAINIYGDREHLGRFEQRENEVAEVARHHRQALHRLETKYTNPHCI
jgi:hemerythrin-like domain-containing protein